MYRRIPIWSVVVCMYLFCTCTGWTQDPAPIPVKQAVGMPDIPFSGLVEADCRVCHELGVPDRHHLLYGQTIPSGSLIPRADADGDSEADTVYACLNCHDTHFGILRDCTECHNAGSPHHTTADAVSRNCKACHGSVVDNFDDGHYIPTYSPSLVTPSPSKGGGSQGEGACDYCHLAGVDDGSGYTIKTNRDLHHGTGLFGDSANCAWCHDMSARGPKKIRRCEECHGPDSLHAIQADSPAQGNIGTIVVGGEEPGYGHIGRDAGPGDSDCQGCHGGYAPSALAPLSGPVVPTVNSAYPALITAGADTQVVLTGSALTNTAGGSVYESEAVLIAADGSTVTLAQGAINERFLAVTVPAQTAPGNYTLQAVKTDEAGKQVASNPVVISVVPEVIITRLSSDGIVTIEGNGFGGYAAGSGTSVTGDIAGETVEATVVSWSGTLIKADFGASPVTVTVNSVFGTATSEVGVAAN
jgi:hypothetical protein